jgi:hypothetical protein
MPHPLVRIVTDSTAALPQEVRSAFPEIAVVPLSVLFGSDSYREGIDIQPEAFYRQLMTSPYHPTTAIAWRLPGCLSADSGEGCRDHFRAYLLVPFWYRRFGPGGTRSG